MSAEAHTVDAAKHFLLDPAREKTTLAHPYLSSSLSGALPESGQHTSGSLCPRLNPHTDERRWDTTGEGRGLTGRLSRDRSDSHFASPTHPPGPLSGAGVRQEGAGGGVVVVVVRGASCDVQKYFLGIKCGVYVQSFGLAQFEVVANARLQAK